MANHQTLISLDGVSVRAGAVDILRDVQLVVGAGEAVGVHGANGAGKTTLLRVIATLVAPSTGSGSVLGASLIGDERWDVRRRIGYVGHVPALYPELTLTENLTLAADLRRLDRSGVAPALRAVGLAGAADRRAERCSHGMQRRAEFARILMADPDILLLDEPHSALDVDAVDLVDTLVDRTLSRGGAAVLVSHDRARVATVASRFVEVASGTVA